MKRSILVNLVTVASLLAPGLYAATHDVTVLNNRFSPNDLTIEVGDTVRWTNSAGFHDVTADDGGWASTTASSFVFERTFSTAEEVRYYCSVHSAPGRSIDTSMNGRINVIEPNQGGFSINPALSDAWFDPDTAGQGFFIIVWKDVQLVFLSWFTYDTERPPEDVTALLGEPGHRWLTAQGPYAGDTAMLDVFLTEGGVFDAADPAPADAVQVGTISITWSGCNAGTMTYDLPGVNRSGNIPIERIVLDNVAACEASQGAP